MRRLQIASLIAALAVLASAPWTLRASTQAQDIPSLTEPGEGLSVLQRDGRGRAAFASVRGQSRGILLPVAPTDPAAERAAVFLDQYGQSFGLSRGDAHLRRTTSRDHLGVEHVKFQQLISGVPVAGGELIVHLRGNRAVGANGRILDRMPADMAPAILPAAAQAVARQVIGRYQREYAARARYSEPRLEIVNRGFLGQRGFSPSRLAWFIEATGPGLRQFIWIDARNGDLVLQFSQLHSAKSRHIYDAGGSFGLPGTSARPEGAPATGNADVDDAYDRSGDVYDYYFSVFGRDSFDGAGAQMVSTVNYDDGRCPNAFWNGDQMVYCLGLAAADDVVGHELTHAVVQYEANLFYLAESGALNESYADIFGETIDLVQHVTGADTPGVRWQMGEDLDPGIFGGPIRNMMDPTVFGHPGKVSDAALFVCDPLFDRGGVHVNSGVPNHAYALMADGGTYNGYSISGIGLDKAARVQYRALSTYLTSSSGFVDNFTALAQSCSDLIGSAGMSAADCTQVELAARAVEMNSIATCRDMNVSVQPAMCPAGGSPTFALQDGFETGGPGWTADDPSRWGLQNFFVHDGALGYTGVDPATVSLHSLSSPAVVIPPGGRMSFAHSFGFETDFGIAYDGGVIEYSTDGVNWLDAASLIDAGPAYNATIDSLTNPLNGREAFGFASLGYQTTRLNLASLAGQTVRFRWRVGSDEILGADGWFLDNVRIYSCSVPAGAPVITGPPLPAFVAGGEQATFTVTATGNALLKYQWLQNGVPIPGATNPTLNVPNVQYDDWGYFSVIVSNNEGTATSDAVLLFVIEPEAPYFTNQPENRTIGEGQTAQFVADVLIPGLVTAYQWQFSINGGASWDPVPAAPPYSGTTTNVLTVTGATTGLTGTLYRLVVSNAIGNAISHIARLNVLPTNLIANGDFGAGPAIPPPWGPIEFPGGNLQWRINGGVFEWNRLGNSTTQAAIRVETGLAVSGTPLAAQFDLGNSAPIRQRVSVLLLDSDFTDLHVCTFWLEAGAPMATYRMRTHTTKPWVNASIYFYAASTHNAGPLLDGGFLRLDNVSVNYNESGSDQRTDCIDPTSPAPPGGAPSVSFIANGDFSAGITAWETFGTITGSVNPATGTFDFIRTPGTPGGVVLQRTGQAVAAGEFLTATFDLGNSSAVRKRVTLLIHPNDFSDLAACTFWLRPGQPLSTYQMKMRATKAWAAGVPTGAVFALYGATTTPEQWIHLDNVSLQRTPGSAISGTECIEPGQAAPPAFTARVLEQTQMAMPAAPQGAPRPAPRDPPQLSARLDFDDMPSLSEWASGVDASGTRLLRWRRAVDVDASTAGKLTFVSSVEGGAGSAEVQVSLDGRVWRTLARVPPEEAWTEVQVDLSEFRGHRIYVQFAYTPLLGESAVWRVNNVRVVRR
jgi:Zn-dependent metalloprotease